MLSYVKHIYFKVYYTFF